MVLKPAEQTPLTALAIAKLGEEAGLPRRRARHRHRQCRGRAGDRPRDDVEPDRPQARLHRVDRGREAPDGAVRRGRQEGLARARRKRAVHRLRRRRPRRGGRRRAALQVPQLGPDVHLREPDLRAVACLRRVRRAAHRRGARSQGRLGPRGRLEDRAADRAPGDRQGRAPRRRRARPGRRAARRRRSTRRALLRTDGDHRRHRRRGDGERRDVRPRRRDRPLRHRAGGGAAGERHAVRARVVLLQPRRRPHLARVGGSRVRDRRHQHRRHLHRGRAVRRRQGVRHRPRGLEVRHRRVARAQVPLHRRDRGRP